MLLALKTELWATFKIGRTFLNLLQQMIKHEFEFYDLFNKNS